MNGPDAFKALNGIFCIYKSSGHKTARVIDIIKDKLSAGTCTHVIVY